MILFYSPGTCALAEMVVLEWLAKPYRLCRLTTEERRGDLYRREINPHGQVPALKLEDAEILTENAALLLLLGDLAPEQRLVPAAGSRERYRMYSWLSWLDSGFHSAHSPFFAPQRYIADESQHQAVREHSAGAIRKALAFLDRHLDGKDWMLLGRRTILDPYVLAMARWSEKRFDHAAEFPNIARLLKTLRQDAGVAFALGVEEGRIVDPPSPAAPFRGHVALADVVG